jgi:ATP-binding cassette subfamily F protein 3
MSRRLLAIREDRNHPLARESQIPYCRFVALLQLTNIEKILGDRLLFDKLSLTIDRGERVGLIGDNGAGKTTLFRTITGEVKPDMGDRSMARSATMGLLEQDPKFTPGNTLIDEAELAFAELHAIAHDMRDCEHQMAEHADEELTRTLEKYQDLQHKFEDLGGYAWRHKLEATLLGVGFAESDFEKPVDSLSGGQRSRVALAKLLINPPDLLLLDEPTNHLDIAGVEWLERYLNDFPGAVLLISHDRRLLDAVCTRIVWLTQRKLRSYVGNYTAFHTQREMEVLTMGRAHEEQQAAIEKEKEYIRRFGAGQRARQAAGRKKRLDRLLGSDQIIEKVANSKGMHLRLTTDQRAGDRLLRVEHLSMSFDQRKIWSEVKFDLKRGERVGILGPNGSGKTTLFRVLTGQLDADDGDIKWGANVSIGYYDQRLDDFDPELSVFDEVLSDVEGYNDKQIRDSLGAMLFTGDDTDKPMKLLSGGERARVQMTKLLMQRPNVLLLDEPTNHLDINACEALEKALGTFEGSLLIVSHDREFLQRSTQRLLVIDPPTVIDFAGTYDQWTQKVKDAAAAKAQAAQQKKQPQKQEKQAARGTGFQPVSSPDKAQKKTQVENASHGAKPRKDNPYARPFGRLSVPELEKKIASTEAEKRQAEFAAADPQLFKNPGKARAAADALTKATQTLAQLEEEYLARGE